jgi:hypothetical protein
VRAGNVPDRTAPAVRRANEVAPRGLAVSVPLRESVRGPDAGSVPVAAAAPSPAAQLAAMEFAPAAPNRAHVPATRRQAAADARAARDAPSTPGWAVVRASVGVAAGPGPRDVRPTARTLPVASALRDDAAAGRVADAPPAAAVVTPAAASAPIAGAALPHEPRDERVAGTQRERLRATRAIGALSFAIAAVTPPPTRIARPAQRPAALPESTPAVATTAYSNRFGPAKAQALEQFGGTDDTERAVRDGLRYLARIQNRDGWGDRRERDAK